MGEKTHKHKIQYVQKIKIKFDKSIKHKTQSQKGLWACH